ncbi:MAG: PKD domain-containing protein [Crocinitomix sp.]|nr:PKD domain-containing protein [Crocinitomix sp.]
MKTCFFISLFILVGCSQIVFGQLSDFSAVNRPSKFIENQGQIADRNGELRPDVLFQISGESVFLRKTGLSYLFSNQNQIHAAIKSQLEQLIDEDPEITAINKNQLESELWSKAKLQVHQVDMNFLNVNENVEIQKDGKSNDYTNYYYGHCADGILDVRNYDKVNYQNIYEGIDATFYGADNGNGLKYDFIVRPFADPTQIQLEWQGADSVFLSQNGELVIENRFTSIYESIPKVYQIIQNDTLFIAAHYHLEQGTKGSTIVRFDLVEYNPNFSLIIDPWVTNYGGEGVDYGLEVDTDPEGNVVMSGETFSATAIAEAGFQMVFGGGSSDSFLAKFNENGVRLWATYYGGAVGLRERGNGVATDSDGNVYVGGATGSTESIATVGAFQPDYGGGLFDSYIAKFDPSGARLWATYFGGPGEDYGMNIGVDIYDNAYIVGYTFSTAAISFDGHQMDLGGFADGFLVKFDPDGNREWATYYGGLNAELIHDVEGDKFGNIVLSGVTTSSEQISTPGVFQEEFAGGQDAFLVKFEQDGTRIWGTYFGLLLVERGDAVTTDTVGNVYMAGKVTTSTGAATPGAFQMENGGISDAFLSKFDPDGNQLWATYVGGELIDYAYAVDVDPISNNVLIAGQTASEDFPTATCAVQNELTGEINAFVTQFLPDGELFCSSYLGVLFEEENVLTVKDCWVYVVGSTKGNMATPGAHQTTYGGDDFDSFLGRVHLASCELTIPELTTYDTESTNVTSCTPCNGSATVDLSDFCLHPRALKTYIWSNGVEEWYTTETMSTISDICEGEYWVEVTINCDQPDTFYFEIDNTASITAEFNMTDVCVGEEVSFTNTSFTIFGDIISNSWDFGDDATSLLEEPVHVYDEPGIYEVELTVENDSECLDSLILTLEVFPNYALVIDTTICQGEMLTLPDGSTITINSDDNWEGTFTSEHGCDSTITVNIEVIAPFFTTVTVYINTGDVYNFPDGTFDTINVDTEHTSFLQTTAFCDSTILTKIIVFDVPEPPVNSSFLAPNIFTPGNDEANNLFYFPSEGVENFSCVVNNRWGGEVFQFNSISDKWDGTNSANGKDCPDGVYFYTYNVTFISDDPSQGQGTVQLLR